MKLKEIFDQLTYGELSQLSIGGGAAGQIRVEDYPRMVNHVNLGLTAVYKRFNLKQKRFTINLQPGQTLYNLSSKYCMANRRSREPVRYIDDTANPFVDDLLKVEQVFSDSGYEFNVNNPVDMLSMNTPVQRQLVVPADIVAKKDYLPEEMRTDTLDVVFRANHAKLSAEDVEPEDIELEIPETHVEALLLFIAARVHTPAGIGESESTGNNYYAKYELACQQLEDQGLQIDKGAQYNRLQKGGWV